MDFKKALKIMSRIERNPIHKADIKKDGEDFFIEAYIGFYVYEDMKQYDMWATFIGGNIFVTGMIGDFELNSVITTKNGRNELDRVIDSISRNMFHQGLHKYEIDELNYIFKELCLTLNNLTTIYLLVNGSLEKK